MTRVTSSSKRYATPDFLFVARWHRAHVQIALRKRNHNVVCDESFVNSAMEFVIQPATVYRPLNPAQQFEVQTRIAETAKSNAWLGYRADLLVICSDAFECRNNMVDVTAIGNTDSDPDAVFLGWPASLVDDLAVAQNAVRNRDFHIIPCEQARAAQTDVSDDAAFAGIENNKVAGFVR